MTSDDSSFEPSIGSSHTSLPTPPFAAFLLTTPVAPGPLLLILLVQSIVGGGSEVTGVRSGGGEKECAVDGVNGTNGDEG